MGALYGLFGSSFFLYGIVFQVACAVHCVKTGRQNYWLWVILMFSIVGCLVYFFVEMLPSLRYSRTMRRTRRTVTALFDPDRDLRESSASYAISNSVETTCAYAEQLINKGQMEDAIAIYGNARKGLFRFDPTLLVGLSHAYFATGRNDLCIETLDELMRHNPEYRDSDMRLLRAMALEAAGRDEEALREYESWGEHHPGPEARCRYALLLKKMGKEERAHALFNEVRLQAVNAPRHYLRQHKDWIDMALRECKAAEQRA
ncbi:MAG TPA: hypothetical protein VFM34_09780 [Moraxellaceae bacterium]|nr:hypothetical protein [Moraxellaceae bacterium]